jgi:phospholipase C
MISRQTRSKGSLAALLGLLLLLCGCQGLVNGVAGPGNGKGIQEVNHIIFMAQENRSFDTYFGQLPAYWAANGFPAQQFDGMPANASNPSFNGTTTIPAFHLATECTENLTPSWDESHLDWNLHNPISPTPTMDGFVYNAAKFAQDSQYTDVQGLRAMGYYDGSDLNYYYFLASNFATSDRWFSPAMDRTQINRMYLFAATSQGFAYPPGTTASDNKPLTAPTIFDALDKAGISWKVYYSDDTCPTGVTGDVTLPHGGILREELSGAASPSTGACTYLTQFAKYAPPNVLPSNVVPVSRFFTDAQNKTLPSVAFIETGYESGHDEHPDNNVQTGAAYAATLINGLMSSQSWNDSVFILTYDEAGGLYDHVPPIAEPNPDGISPIDLAPNDICANDPGGINCDFNISGFRVPLIVVSPFTRKNYVSHTPTDYTAILKFIETRFGLQPLNNRDAAQMDMTEFFDFGGIPWSSPPNPPTQFTTGACTPATLQ